jgi:hypothetical protein
VKHGDNPTVSAAYWDYAGLADVGSRLSLKQGQDGQQSLGLL